MRIITIIILTLFISVSAFATNMEKLFYITTDLADFSYNSDLLKDIKDHANAISIIAPQIYQLDENGIISGNMDSRLLALAKETNIKIMPLIINIHFDQDQFHNFLHNPAAQERAIAGMLALCKKYQFYGLQFDFENININDKTQFTHFFQLAANKLHQNHFILSIAVVPRTSDISYTDYDRWYFNNWSGAYDYEALGKNSDFISIMSYDKHTTLTTPGPLAPMDWVEKTIQNLLKVVPANKLSLGVPTYSGYWTTGMLDPGNVPEKYKYRSKETQISYSMVLSLLSQFNQPLIWHDQWKSSYAMYTHHERNEYLFVEDAQSFKKKLKLVNLYHLRGISVWKLGIEDPAIWKEPYSSRD